MKKDKWVWMPHAAHSICGHECKFRLATCVGNYIVSTVGELPLPGETYSYKDIGSNRKYETLVFSAEVSERECCPYQMEYATELEFKGYNHPGDALRGHMALCKKWARRG